MMLLSLRWFPVLKKIHIENYKCLRDVTVDLTPLTVLIGKNDTGKSSFLEALNVLGRLAGGESVLLGKPEALRRVSWRGQDPAAIAWTAELINPVARYTLRIQNIAEWDRADVVSEAAVVPGAELHDRPNDTAGQWSATEGGSTIQLQHSPTQRTALGHIARGNIGPRRLMALPKSLQSTTPYAFDPDALRAPAAPDPDASLAPDGTGLAAVLDRMLGTSRKNFDAITRELGDAVPMVTDVIVETVHTVVTEQPTLLATYNPLEPSPRTRKDIAKAVGFVLAGGHKIDASLASDGVLLFLAYLVLVNSDQRPAIILLEEPENGVHPRQLERVAKLLQRLVETTSVQVIMTTHSPYLLDFVPKESVRVFGRRPNGEVVVGNLVDLPGFKQRHEDGLSLGELWFNVGEDELLNGMLDAPVAAE